MSLRGIRVVRGPHWKWSNQDGGEGNLGTVCAEDAHLANVFIVKWDDGMCRSYRAGSQNKYDLRIFDNSYLAIMHYDACKGCNSESIVGMKYRCSTCSCYDLCASCYHNDKHNIAHKFTLFPTNTTIGINLPSRECSKEAKLRSGSKYYYDHLPLLGKEYGQIEKTETSNEEDEQVQTVEEAEECIGCDKPASENVSFEPCKHKLACIDCAVLFKKCMKCRVLVQRISINQKNPEEVRLRRLQDMVSKLEDMYCCVICTEHIANIVFNCGHRACKSCSDQITACHMCREIISLRITT